jgi:hypothetical protein
MEGRKKRGELSMFDLSLPNIWGIVVVKRSSSVEYNK